jgi:hypothetical protein
MSWMIWTLMEATEWRHLPFPGGLLDQPDWWLQDMRVIAWRRNRLKGMQRLATRPPDVEAGWIKEHLQRD